MSTPEVFFVFFLPLNFRKLSTIRAHKKLKLQKLGNQNELNTYLER